MVRELLGADGLDSLVQPLASMLDALFGGGAVLATYLASENLTYIPQELTVTHYQHATGRWVTDVTTSDGVHYLRFAEEEECRNATHTLLGEAFTQGLSDPTTEAGGGVAFLCAAGSPNDVEFRVVSARKMELRAHRLVQPDLSTADSEPLSSPTEALDFLIGERQVRIAGRPDRS